MYNPVIENNIVLTAAMLFWISLCIFCFIMNSLWFGLLPNTSLLVADYIVLAVLFPKKVRLTKEIQYILHHLIKMHILLYFVT